MTPTGSTGDFPPGGKPVPDASDRIKPPRPAAPAPFGEWSPDQGVRPVSTAAAAPSSNPLAQPNAAARQGTGVFRFTCNVPRTLHALAAFHGFPVYRAADWGGDVLVQCTQTEASQMAERLGDVSYIRIGDNLGGIEQGGQPVPTEVQVRSECEAVGRTPPSNTAGGRYGWER